ncbi:MAG: type IV pilus twitching motility protein PilT [Candidatus Eisenbacteria bacterium]|nr:type IV pilus twitching motility protein PilT [Candidatus Eisenbacteria bacterium]
MPSVDLHRILEKMIARSASDLHLRAGAPPVLRIDGTLVPLDHVPLGMEDMDAITRQIVPPDLQESFARSHEVDFSFGISGLARFRANFYYQRGTIAGAIRCIPLTIPEIEALHLPAIVSQLAMKPRGLILVTGTVGSGKSTTLAAMIDLINRTTEKNIITVEDPIEFLHRNQKSIISQREVGQDTLDYLAALKYILRQDPDVILIGEIRDQASMSVALMAADTGHLVLSTLHTTDAAQTVNRIISFYPPHQHAEIRFLLASSLQAVISMRLLPMAGTPGRVPAVEVMINTETVRECLRDPDRTGQIRDIIADGFHQYGMQTFDQSLMKLYREGLVSLEEALRQSTTPTEFELRLRGIHATSDTTWEAFENSRAPAAAAGKPGGEAARPPERPCRQADEGPSGRRMSGASKPGMR